MSRRGMSARAKLLTRLTPALDAIKERDAAALRDKQAAVAEIERDIAATHAAVRASAASLDLGDLTGRLAQSRFETASAARVEALTEMLALRRAEADTARAALARSHGAVEGCERLIKDDQPPPKRGG
ncbi:MAG: hypothetical protein AAF909_15940 [Pseudomonadota bacterium]